MVIAALMCAVVPVHPSAAVTAATAVTADLDRRAVRIQRLEDGTISYFDGARRLRVEPVEQFVQLLIDGSANRNPTSATRALVQLADGQRLIGGWAGGDGQTVHLDHEVLGRLALPLETIRLLVPRQRPQDLAARLQEPRFSLDRLVLVNGDVLEGLLAAVGPGSVSFELPGEAGTVALSLERVAAVHLANPGPQTQRVWDLVELIDGTRVWASALQIASDRLTFAAALADRAAPAVSVDLAQVERINFARHGMHLIDLAALEPELVAGGQVFGVPMGPRQVAGGLWLHAPVTVRFALPPGVRRFAALATVTGGGPGHSPWTDFLLTVQVDGRKSEPIRLTAASHRALINVPAQGRYLKLKLDPGTNGPVMDRLLLRDAVLLVDRAVESDRVDEDR